MSLDAVRHAFLWCGVLNYGLLAFWCLLYLLPHEWLTRLWGKWFHVTAEQFNAINFAGIVFYKVCIFVFNLVPFVALSITG